MTVVFTGDASVVAFKQRLLNVLVANELGSKSAYAIAFADPGSPSGWSFGWNQMDVRHNADGACFIGRKSEPGRFARFVGMQRTDVQTKYKE